MDLNNCKIAEYPFDDLEKMLEGTGWHTSPSHSAEFELKIENGVNRIEAEFGDMIVLFPDMTLAAFPHYMFEKLTC